MSEAGVEVYERTRVRAGGADGRRVVAETAGGRVRAGAAVLAWPRSPGTALRRRLTVTSSHIAITEPVPDVLDEIGWTGGECITDSRSMVHYFRTTRDGRIAFGWGGGRVVLGARTHGRAERDPDVIADDRSATCSASSPALAGRRIEQAWGGPIDVSPSHLPVIAELEPGIHCASATRATASGRRTCRPLARLAGARHRRRGEPPGADQPAGRPRAAGAFRYLGGSLIRRAIMRQESAMERGERAGRASPPRWPGSRRGSGSISAGRAEAERSARRRACFGARMRR